MHYVPTPPPADIPPQSHAHISPSSRRTTDMSFDAFIQSAWTDHATDAAAVADRLKGAAALVETPEHGVALAGIVTHVFGEHLGDWTTGVATLNQLLSVTPVSGSPDALQAINRSIATLRLASNPDEP